MFGKSKKNEEKKVEESSLKKEDIKKNEDFLKKISSLEDEIKKNKEEAAKWKNKFYEEYANIANLRKEIEKERLDIYKYRLFSFADKIVRVLDGFDIALKYENEDVKIKNFLIGFKTLYDDLRNILKEEGIKEIDPKKGDLFDADNMKVMEVIFQEGEKEDNKIVETKFKGYKLSDRLIRPAMVIVTTNKKNNNNSNEQKNINK